MGRRTIQRLAMSEPTADDRAARVGKRALALLQQIDDLQAQIRRAECGLDLLAWHTFSIAYSASDPDPDTKPTPDEVKAIARQLRGITSDIKLATTYADQLVPICTQKNGE